MQNRYCATAAKLKMKHQIILICLGFFIGNIHAQIVGGEDAEIEDFPYTASIRLFDIHNCGACIIGEKHVLTAAHCVQALVSPYFDVSVNVGSTSSRDNVLDGASYRIAKVYIHPGWTDDADNYYIHDIAVIRLVGRIRFNAKQQMIKLASEPPVSGTDAVISGWGHKTTGPNAQMSPNLQKLRLTLITNTDCNIEHSVGNIHDTQVCAYYTRGHGTCFGDSGSPLVNDIHELVGILSYSYEVDCDIGQPEIYSNVYAYRDFIASAMSQ